MALGRRLWRMPRRQTAEPEGPEMIRPSDGHPREKRAMLGYRSQITTYSFSGAEADRHSAIPGALGSPGVMSQ